MFREMRRKDRKLNLEEIEKILKENSYGILSVTNTDNGYPYGIPLSYFYMNNSVYFHSATTGLKNDSILKDNRVCFTVVGKTEILPEKFSTKYESVIIYGKVFELTERDKKEALFGLVKKYSFNFLNEGKIYIDKLEKMTKVYKIEIENISGKSRK